MSIPARRLRSIHADNGDVWLTVTVTVGVRDKALTRDEHKTLIDDVTSRIMPGIADAPYLNVPLSRLKVSR